MNSPGLLNEFLQQSLRESIKFKYERMLSFDGSYRFFLQLGSVCFVGDSFATKDDAKRSVANKALIKLSRFSYNEGDMRKYLGLQKRLHIAETDSVRENLKLIKRRSTRHLPQNGQRDVMRAVVAIYSNLEMIDGIFGIVNQVDR